jgi:hypothetical protein
MSGYEIVSLDDLGPYASERHGDALLIPLRSHLDVRAFGVNAWTAGVGKTVVPPHTEESGNEELYAVVRGRATFTVGEDTIDAPTGTLVHATAGTFRTAVVEEPGTIVLAVGATPGEPFQVHGWDDTVAAFGEAQAGAVDAGRAIMRRLVADNPSWEADYNLACFEARYGDADAAFEHLRAAIAAAPTGVRDYARRDDDFARLRDDPRWAEVVG